mmetsp:Transcript_23507/g.50302  ORF Transcript_23507/g.50302 Transcript_23507/m.50302 type:complete len:243 (-) Transcript_23507:242-970(-)
MAVDERRGARRLRGVRIQFPQRLPVPHRHVRHPPERAAELHPRLAGVGRPGLHPPRRPAGFGGSLIPFPGVRVRLPRDGFALRQALLLRPGHRGVQRHQRGRAALAEQAGARDHHVRDRDQPRHLPVSAGAGVRVQTRRDRRRAADQIVERHREGAHTGEEGGVPPLRRGGVAPTRPARGQQGGGPADGRTEDALPPSFHGAEEGGGRAQTGGEASQPGLRRKERRHTRTDLVAGRDEAVRQ